MKTSSEKHDKRIEELEDKVRALEIENKNNTWSYRSSGKIFKFITLGSVTIVGAGVILQQQKQLESQKEAITFLFDKLKEVHGESKQCEELKQQINNLKDIYNSHSHDLTPHPQHGWTSWPTHFGPGDGGIGTHRHWLTVEIQKPKSQM